MDRKDILNDILAIIKDLKSVDTKDLTEATSLTADLEMDSLDLAELAMALGDKFEVEIEDSEAEKITTIGAAVDIIEKMKK